MRKDILDKFVRVRHKAIEGRLCMVSESGLKCHITWCALFRVDSESLHTMSEEIGTECSIPFWIPYFVTVFFFVVPFDIAFMTNRYHQFVIQWHK